MDFHEQYRDKENIELLRIIENASEYTKECVNTIYEIFTSRALNIIEYRDDLMLIHRQLVRKKLETFNPFSDKLSFHTSQFLPEQEIKTIYKNELERFMQKQDHFGIDVWSYAIGAI